MTPEELARRLGEGDALIAQHERRLNSINGSIKAIADSLEIVKGTASGLVGQLRGIERLLDSMEATAARAHTPDTCAIRTIAVEAKTTADSAAAQLAAARNWLGGWRAAVVLLCAAGLGGSVPRFLDALSNL